MQYYVTVHNILINQIHKFSIKSKIGRYWLAYCRQNIRTGLRFLYGIIRSYLQFFIYIHNNTYG